MNRHLTEANKPKKRLRIFHGRMYFALQALAGAAWWLATALMPTVADATLGGINPLLIAIVDIPLFVIGSALAALNFRWAVWIATGWTVLVALVMVIYATATTEAGLGAVLMIFAAIGSVFAGVLMLLGRIPTEKLLVGPFAFHSSHTRVRSRVLVHTTIQIVVFWGIFLVIIPVIIKAFEDRWNLAYKFPILLVVVGFALLALSSVGVWSGPSDRELRLRHPAALPDGPSPGQSRTLCVRPQPDGHCGHRPGRVDGSAHRFVARRRVRTHRLAAVELAHPPPRGGRPHRTLR